MPIPDSGFMLRSLEFLATFFIFFVGLCALAIIVVYILDVTQTKQALRRNDPIIGHFRYFFEKVGKFFRQHFFAMDREEMPFNRTAKDLDNTTAFGSTRNLTPSGTVLFVNCPFPTLGTDAAEVCDVTIGPTCDKPYVTNALFNISGMSYGALSKPAVQALSSGAAQNDNTGPS